MPLLTLRNISLHLGHEQLFDQVNLIVQKGQRIGLLGRNGAGKSTLLKLIQGQTQADSGEIESAQNLTIRSLIQEVPHGLEGSVFDVVFGGLGELKTIFKDYENLTQKPDLTSEELDSLMQLQQQIDAHQAWNLQQEVHTVLSKLQLDGQMEFTTLSGGLKRRVLLAQALVAKPDLLLLDEPTNHLDIEAIQWLEQFLINYQGTLLFITHDRTFLQNLATDILELDRGHLINFHGSYQQFLNHKEALLEAEETQVKHFKKKLAQEETWIRQGIKARRTRNEGRVRALKKMREQKAQLRQQQGSAKVAGNEAEQSGRIVIKAKNISYSYDNTTLFEDFSTTLMRGDKVGILGPNGCGKSTLLKVLLKKLEPTTGSVKQGTNLQIAYFDQMRAQLNENDTLQNNVGEGRDFITIDNKQKHVLSYLQDFLFTPQRARSPIHMLSGGERNRLLLAKLLSKPSNVLVLDEPTNDLDMETLELLESLLVNYQGTILLVSHDRSFINHVVTSTIAFEAGQPLREYVGGYDDWLHQKPKTTEKTSSKTSQSEEPKQNTSNNKKLSYKDQRRLEQLPQEIEELETQIESLQAQVSAPDFYQKPAEEIKTSQEKLSALESKLKTLYQLWEGLE